MTKGDSIRAAALVAAAEKNMPPDFQEALVRNGWLDAIIAASVAEDTRQQEDDADWADPASLIPADVELPDETERGFAGQVMDLAWPIAYGNHQPPSFWWAVSFAVQLSERVARLRAEKDVERQGLQAFAREIVSIALGGGDADGGLVQELALRHGLLVETRFDPDRHSDPENVFSAGDAYFIPAGPLAL